MFVILWMGGQSLTHLIFFLSTTGILWKACCSLYTSCATTVSWFVR